LINYKITLVLHQRNVFDQSETIWRSKSPDNPFEEVDIINNTEVNLME